LFLIDRACRQQRGRGLEVAAALGQRLRDLVAVEADGVLAVAHLHSVAHVDRDVADGLEVEAEIADLHVALVLEPGNVRARAP
jgi:hypothetical protein